MTIGAFVKAYSEILANTRPDSPEFYSDVEKLLEEFRADGEVDSDDYDDGYAAGIEAARDALNDL